MSEQNYLDVIIFKCSEGTAKNGNTFLMNLLMICSDIIG